MTALFVCYEKTPSGHGRITTSSTVIDHEGYARDLAAAGQSFMLVPLDGWTGYFTLDQDGAPAEAHVRHAFPGALEPSEVAMLQVATLPAVPACEVRVSGPATSQTIEHPGGDLNMRFGLPGTYTIAFEAFPLLPFEARLSVRQPTADQPVVDQPVVELPVVELPEMPT